MAVPMSFGGGRTFDTCKVIEKYERWITEAESAQDEAETQRREALEDAGWAEGQSMKEGPGRRKPKWYVVNRVAQRDSCSLFFFPKTTH